MLYLSTVQCFFQVRKAMQAGYCDRISDHVIFSCIFSIHQILSIFYLFIEFVWQLNVTTC